MIAPEYPAQLCRSQHGCKGKVASECTNFVPSALGSVQRRQQQGNLSGADGLADLFETGNGEAGAAGEPDGITAALCKQGLDAIRKPRPQGDRPARRARKKPPPPPPLDCIAARRQPPTPS